MTKRQWNAAAKKLANVAANKWMETWIGLCNEAPDDAWGIFANLGTDKTRNALDFTKKRASEIGLIELANGTSDETYSGIVLFAAADEQIRKSLLAETWEDYYRQCTVGKGKL